MFSFHDYEDFSYLGISVIIISQFYSVSCTINISSGFFISVCLSFSCWSIQIPVDVQLYLKKVGLCGGFLPMYCLERDFD